MKAANRMKNVSVMSQRGLTLVEMMVAIVISLILTAGVIQIFLGNKQTYNFHEALSRNQEGGRYAMEVLSRDIRMAGFTGCPVTDRVANTLNNADTSWWANFAANQFRGYDGTDNTFPARSFGTAPGDRVSGTDAFVMIGGGETAYTIVQHQVTSAQFKLNQLHNMQNGSIAMACDANQVSIMQLTNVNASNVTMVHNTGAGSGNPGNCTKGLGFPTVCTTNGTPYQYGPDASFVEFIPRAYYVGVSSTGQGRSLWRVRTTVNAATSSTVLSAEELVEGLEDMHLLYGVDTTGNGRVNSYVNAASVTDWQSVLSVRLSLLMVSGQGNVTGGVAQSVVFRDADLTSADRRLRNVFTTTVGIRNRLP